MESKKFVTLNINLVVLVFALIFIAIVVGIYLVIRGLNGPDILPSPTPTATSTVPSPTPSTTSSPSPSPDENGTFPTPTPTPDDFSAILQVPTGISSTWKTYISSNHHVSINFLENMQINDTHDSLKFNLYEKETQNGINLTFFRGNFNNEISFKNFVLKEKSELKENSSELKKLSLNNYSGYYFTTEENPWTEYYYLEIKNDQYLKIINKTTDPNNLDYTDALDKIISSFEILN